MFGGSSKLGRGGGRGGGGAGGPPRGRSSYPPPSKRNPSAIGRMSSGGGGSSSGPRQRSNSGGKAAAAPPAVEETFSLVPSKSAPAFAMIIRLAPDLVEEIRRVEAQGGTAKIKFDAFSNNTSGNIINVGGKEFKFTWSRELGDLCDIYEEHQSGEDGDGVLIEAGCAWRKLNVQRTLDESTTNHMKMRSVEAEQRTKSRKAIVLDPGNPSLTKQLALAEANTWRVLNKQKKEPPHKKRKVDPPPVPIGGPKPAFRPGASTSAGKGRPSSSPGRSPPNQSDASPSPYGIGNFAKSHTAIEDVPPVLTKGNENSVLSENNTSTKATNALKDMSGNRANNANKPIDLQTLVINLLKDAPMSLKALEKAVGDKVPNAAKKVEPILKKIANFQAPGRYFLKSGAELESYKKLSPEQASSPEDQQLWPMAERNHDQLSVPGADNVENISVCQPSGQCQLDGMPLHPEGQSSSPENVDIECLSPGIPGEEKASENREGQACSSSESASDSDSGSGSESGSSSDSDASNSKEGSDEDVDIMSDDDREPQHTIGSAVASTVPSQTGGCGFGHNEFAEKQEDDKFDAVDTEGQGSDAVDIEDHDSDAVDIEGDDSEAVDIEGDDSEAVDIDRLESDAVDIDRLESDAVDIEGNNSDEGHGSDGARNFYPDNNWKMEATEDGGNSMHEPFSSDHDKLRERQNFIGRLFDDTDNKDNFESEQSDSSDRHARGKTKTGSELENFNQKSVRVKRLKDESINQFPSLGKDSQPSENMYNPSPKKYDEESIKASASQMKDPADRDYANCDPHRAPTTAFIEKSNSDYVPTSFKISKSTQIKPSEGSGRSNKHTNASGIVSKYAEGDGYPHEILSSQAGKASVDIQRDSNHPKDKFPRIKKDGESTSKRALLVDGSNRKHGELDGNEKDKKIVSGLSLGSSPLYNQRTSSPNFHVKGNGSFLQKVVTDLELGELRECEDTAVKQLERKSSFRQSDNNPSTSENRDMESDKRKRPRKSNSDSKKTAPPQAENVKGMSEQGVEDSARSHKSVMISRTQYHSEADTSEIGPQYSKLEGTNNKSRQNDSGARPGSSIEGYGETNRKTSSVTPQPQGSKRKSISRSSRESKRHPSGATANFVNGQKDTGAIPSDGVDWRKRETFFNEEDYTYLKHEKASPELKGPISDHSQYKAYIQEYQDKYGSYCSLNKILENYRNEFQRMGEDLEFAKSRDVERYNKILLQLKESYRKSGERHKRLKKIFVVLHEELKHLKQRMKDYAFSHGKD